MATVLAVIQVPEGRGKRCQYVRLMLCQTECWYPEEDSKSKRCQGAEESDLTLFVLFLSGGKLQGTSQ